MPASDGKGRGALEGLVVVDLTTALSGPYSTLILAALGAEVIKIEPPGGHDNARGNPPFVGVDGIRFERSSEEDVSLTVINRHRNKKSMTLDLKSPEGKRILEGLVAKADILVENYSFGVTRRLGVDYESMSAINPRLVYCSLSGFGEGSPLEELKTMDILVQAMSGLMEVTGFADGPPTRVGIPLADVATPLYGVIGILSAVTYQRATGIGQHVEVSMIDALVSLISIEHFDAIANAGYPLRTGNHLPRLAPFGVFATNDGFIAVSGAVDVWARGIMQALGQPELADDPRFATRGARAANAGELSEIIEAWSSTISTAEAIRLLYEVNSVPSVPVRTPMEAVLDPVSMERGAVIDLGISEADGGGRVVGTGIPIMFSAEGRASIVKAPALGQDTDSVLIGHLGLDPSDVEDLRRRGII